MIYPQLVLKLAELRVELYCIFNAVNWELIWNSQLDSLRYKWIVTSCEGLMI